MGKHVVRFALACAASIGVLLLGELVVRLWQPAVFDSPMVVYDPELGWTGRPNHRQRLADGRWIEFNSLGYRGAEPDPGDGRSGRHFLVVGDSFTEALEVDLEETYWSLAASKLQRHSGEQWSAVSFGVADYGTVQASLVLARHLDDFAPSFVLVQVFPMNDVANNSPAAAFIASSQDGYRPYLAPGSAGLRYLAPRATWLRQRSHLGRLVLATGQRNGLPWPGELSLLTVAARRAYATDVCRSFYPACDDGLLWLLSNTLAPADEQLPMIREGWRATEQALEQIALLCQRRQVPMLLFAIPYWTQINPERMPKSVPFRMQAEAPERRLASLELPGHVVFVPLLQNLRAVPEVLPYASGHLNPHGHLVVAEALATTMLNGMSQGQGND